ncbi:MAG: hypothetical protein H6907_11475 [Hyphomicrobiales bacterium]|nr:hypothetical protein [bacterium]MCP5367669.1 hypothetical protein [Hyphomicrobiales bacterium]MCP5372342.1 hypothetical protein [Hyphomicrobiales bacterium]
MTNRVKILLSILAMSAVVFVSGWIVVSVSNVPVVLFKPACKTADGEYVRLEGRVTYEFMDALLDVHRAGADVYGFKQGKRDRFLYHPLGLFGNGLDEFEVFSSMAYHWIQDQKSGQQMGTSGWLRGPPVPCDDMRKVAIEPGSG